MEETSAPSAESVLSALREQLQNQRPVPWEQLPDFPLYMDQVLAYMERQVLHLAHAGEPLTAAMVNNYIKKGLMPRAEGKKYNREHLVALTMICTLKQVMPVRDIQLLLQALQQEHPETGENYGFFLSSLETALNHTASMMEEYSTGSLAEAALHFALLSCAAGMVGCQYVALLQENDSERKNPRTRKKEESTDA